ncbi:MAG: transcriptional regulator TbsP [Halanaeroarchaeum sp.]
MTANLLGTSVADVLDAVLDDGPPVLYVVNPSARIFEHLVNAAVAVDGDLPELRVLGDAAMLKSLMDDFLVASTTADLVESGDLVLRTVDDTARCSTCVSPDRVVAMVEAGDDIGGLSTTDASFTEAAAATAEASWEDAEPFGLRTPAISRVLETLGDEIGEEVRDDFRALLDELDAAVGDGEGLDEVTVSLLVAARNSVLLYDISKWGEDVGIASKATFSRTKTKLEDVGLIETEKVPIDVGRPRLRLRLAADVADEEPADLVRSATDALAA